MHIGTDRIRRQIFGEKSKPVRGCRSEWRKSLGWGDGRRLKDFPLEGAEFLVKGDGGEKS